MNLFSLKPAFLALLLFWQDVPREAAPLNQFRYSRALILSGGPTPGQTCAIFDAAVFAHAAASLKDLRLYSGQAEVPYAITVSEPLEQESEDARILNLIARPGHVGFDLEMPHRPYTYLTLDLAAKDFIAKAVVSGGMSANDKSPTPLGIFTLFDLTSQHLSHSTSIPLLESTFPYLHVDLALVPARGSSSSAASLNAAAIVKAAVVPPSREAQTLYITTQRDEELRRNNTDSIATFKVQTRVPIERILFTLPPGYKGNFSRAVKVSAHGVIDKGAETQEEVDKMSGNGTPFQSEETLGSILYVHKSESGSELSAKALSIPVAIGSNMQQPAVVEVALENGKEMPLPIRSVELQMRQRRICFNGAFAANPLTLFYGDPLLDAPAYDDSKLFQAAASPRIAQLGPEIRNEAIGHGLTHKPAKQHPVLRWIALLGCVCIFALLVIRATKRASHR